MVENNPSKPILIVDDEMSWIVTLRTALRLLGKITHIVSCTESQTVPSLLATNEYSLVLLDLTMPNVSGEELLDYIGERHPELPVIIISGANQVATAVNCMKKGADDFLIKTDDLERIVNSVKKILRTQELKEEHRKLSESLAARPRQRNAAFDHIITRNQTMLGIFSYLEAIALSREPVLVQGESGTGKELIVQALHQLSCPTQPFIAVNVAGLDDVLFSDTLFGHQVGAYTGANQPRRGMIEEAAGGILFLDEIGDLSQSSQVKLLRLLQSGEYFPLGCDTPLLCRARIIAATNQNLEKKEAAGTFRRDLLFRLKTHRVTLPALRERHEDIPLLVDYFISEAIHQLGKKRPGDNPDLISLLQSYSFPGNHRELRAIIYDAVSLHHTGPLSIDRFADIISKDKLSSPVSESTTFLPPESAFIFPEHLPTLKQMSQLLVDEALRRTGGNQSHAARFLGITQQALNRRLKGKF